MPPLRLSVPTGTLAWLGILSLLLVLAPGHFPLPAAHAENLFSVEAYLELADEVDRADEERARTEEGSAAWRSATEASLASRQRVLTYLTEWIRSGELGARERPQADATRRVLLQNIIVLNAQLGRCDEARGSLLAIEQLVDFQDEAEVEGYEIARESVADCEAHGTSAEASAPAEATPVPIASPPSPVAEALETPAQERGERDTNILPYVLIGTGGAILVGGLAYDLALLGDLSTFSEIQDICADRSRRSECLDRAPEAQDIADKLNGARPVIITLYALGAATAATGTILLLTRPPEEARAAGRVSLRNGPGAVGIGLGAHFW